MVTVGWVTDDERRVADCLGEGHDGDLGDGRRADRVAVVVEGVGGDGVRAERPLGRGDGEQG
jgi:hypothetical protein